MDKPLLLVVEDERVDRAIAESAGVRAGFEVAAVGSVAEAEVLIAAGMRFDCAVLDLSLRSDDGLAMLHILARHNSTASIVFVSGFDARVLGASQRLGAGLGLHVAGTLRKPLAPAALCRIMLRQVTRDLRGRTAGPLATLEEVRIALAERRIVPWFQPKVSFVTGEIVGAEALARWIRPGLSPIAPDQFVSVAERGDLASALTISILDQSLAACARWRARRPGASVAVNLPPQLLADVSLADRIDRLLQVHCVPPGALVLEVTEGEGIPETVSATENLARLRIKGIGLAVDDFGIGHSSLLSLVHMPFDEMKIDRAFVHEAIDSGDSRKVVRASASLGRELGLRVVAEGVETAEQAELVRQAGCHVGQGWLYGAAMPADAFEGFLDRWVRLPGADAPSQG